MTCPAGCSWVCRQSGRRVCGSPWRAGSRQSPEPWHTGQIREHLWSGSVRARHGSWGQTHHPRCSDAMRDSPTKRTVRRRKELKLQPPAWMLPSGPPGPPLRPQSRDCRQYSMPSPTMICGHGGSQQGSGWGLTASPALPWDSPRLRVQQRPS